MVNDSSMQFTMVGTDLLSTIQWKSDYKLRKQQLLDDFWWYLSVVLLGGTVIFLLFFHYQSVIQIFYMFLSSPLYFVWYIFNRNMVRVSWKFLLAIHDQYPTYKIGIVNNFVYWSPKWLVSTGNIFNVYIHFFLLFQIFLSTYIVTTLIFLLSSTLFASVFTSASSLASSATCSSSYINKSGYFPPKCWLFHCSTNYTCLYVISTWCPFK